MKKIVVTDEKIFRRAIRLLAMKDNIHLRTSHAKFLGKGSQCREEDSENRILL